MDLSLDLQIDYNLLKSMIDPKAMAMVFNEVEKPFQPLQVNLPVLSSGEVIVEITYSTICTSDLHSFYGRRCAHAPSVLGHEVIGKVIHLAEDKPKDFYGDALEIGDLITWSVYAHDHNGKMAAKGIPQKSADLFKYGHEKIQENDVLSGGFATHCHLRNGTDIFKIPAAISSKESAPLNCTHATIAGAIRLAGDLKGKNILVIGAGMLGISACAMSRFEGAANIYSMDLDAQRIALTKEFGADSGFDASLSIAEITEKVKPLGGIDVVIDTSGSAEAMEKGLALLNIGGISIWVGAVYSQRDLAINAESIVRRIITIKGLHNYIPEDLAKAIKFLEASHTKYPFDSLVAVDFPLPQLDEAFKMANESGKYRIGVTPN